MPVSENSVKSTNLNLSFAVGYWSRDCRSPKPLVLSIPTINVVTFHIWPDLTFFINDARYNIDVYGFSSGS
jgi:hypothetical protein